MHNYSLYRIFMNKLFGIFLIALIYSAHAMALDPLLSLRVGEAETKLKVIEDSFTQPEKRISADILKEFQEQGLFVKKTANECIDFNEDEINSSADDLELLGVQSLSEEKEVTDKRQSLNQTMLANAQQLASCRLLLLRAHEIIDIALKKQQQKLAEELLARSDHVLLNVKNNLLNPAQVIDASMAFIQTDSGLTAFLSHFWYLAGIVLLVIILTLFIKGWSKAVLKRYQSEHGKGYSSQFQLALMSCIDRYVPAIMLSGGLSSFYAYQFFINEYLDFLALLVFGLFLYILVILAIRVLLNPCAPGERLTSLPSDVSVLLYHRLRLLSKLLLIGFLFYSAIQIHDFPPQVTALLRNIYLFLLVLNLIWAVWLLRYYEGFSNIHFLRVLIIFGLLVCLGADWLGYTNLANYILIGIGGSIVLWAVTIFILRLWTDILDSLDEGRYAWQQRLRKRIGVKNDEFLPGSIWFRFTFALVLWSIFAVALLKVWGLPDASLLSVREAVTEGFELGTFKIVPIKVIIGLLSFAIMLSFIGWIKRRMDKSWLSRSRMDRGSKEAMISLTGYSGVAIAFLVALTIAGAELANLALIAGALSVGIGFGLQNIVNNFVSGLILLFERPIKTGDWIAVSGTEGYVKKISIRSTQIQTFDRSDVIVPNSELISGQVTNWMFRDSIGRVIVPIGVAYGTDPQRVKEILLDIAYQHEAVICKSPILPKPWVLFREFGDSALNFELRCFIKVVDSRLSTISDLNFEIEKAFREADIQIPFPQRDVHIIEPSNDLIANNDDIKA